LTSVIGEGSGKETDNGNAANSHVTDKSSPKTDSSAAAYRLYKAIRAQAPKLRALSLTQRFYSNIEYAVIDHLRVG
jgi:hypothetical protein